MQIHHDGNLHWVCSRLTEEGVFLYDSAFSGRTSEELDIQLALLYANNASSLHVNVVPIQQQRGGSDCGLFAAAVCTVLASGGNPANIRWRQASMQRHLMKCIETENLTPFPTIGRSNTQVEPELSSHQTTSLVIEIWCVCKLPQFAYNNMIECSKCQKWFHKPCVGLPDDNSKVVRFPCPICTY